MDNQNNLQKAKISNLIEFEPPKMVNIPSPAIHIENNISLMQKKLWFELVYHAFPNMGIQRKHSIKLSRLRELLGWSESTSSDDRLKEALRGLKNTEINWNIFGKDKKRVWETYSLLAGCQIPEDSGICIFDFSVFLEERFLAMGQEAYVKIDLIVSKKFQSKYALAIYCLALDYLIMEKGYSEKKFSIEEIRKYLGIKEDEYKLIADINRWIIKPSEEEINTNSDMNIEIRPYKEGRKIAGYKFCISLKEGRLRDYIEKKNRFNENTIPQIENKQINIFEHVEVKEVERVKTQVIKTEIPKREVIKIENEVLKKFFAKYNISITTETIQKKFKEIQEMLGADKLENYLSFLSRYAEKEYNKGTIKNFSGFFVALFKDDVQIENYLHELSLETRKLEEKRNRVESKLEGAIKDKYNSAMLGDFEEYLVENIEVIEDKFIEVINTHLIKGFARDFLISSKNKGIVDKTLILNYISHFRMPLITELKPYQDKLGYKKPSYEEWKLKNINEKYLNELRVEIEKLDI